MANIVLLFACLVIGMVLHRAGRLPDNAPATINGFIIHVSLPALILGSLHGMDLQPDLLGVAAMPWILFGIGAALFWWLGTAARAVAPDDRGPDHARRARQYLLHRAADDRELLRHPATCRPGS